MERIIISAGAWGYGPSSTAIMIAKKLSENYIIDFIGEGIANEFARNNIEVFDRIYSNVNELKKEYLFAISIIEPSILLWSAINDISSICVDNIYWIWEWPQFFLDDIVDGKYNPKSVDDIANTRKVTSDLEKYGDYSFMYSIPRHIFLQGFTSSITENIMRFRDKVEIIGPIVDTSHKKCTNKNKILVTCSGMKNPYINTEDIITYIKILKNIFENVIDDRFIFTVPSGFENIGKKILGYERVYCLSHTEMLDAINESMIVFAPAGMAIMFESIAYETMLYILPEQHDGSFSNYKTFCETCCNLYNINARELFPNILLGSYDKNLEFEEIRDFYLFYNDDLKKNSGIICGEMREKIETFFYKDNFEERIETYKQLQTCITRHLVGNFDGIECINSYLNKLFSEE